MKTKSIKIAGMNVIQTISHYIMSIPCTRSEIVRYPLHMICITNKPELMIDAAYSASVAKHILQKNGGKCDVFNFYNEKEQLVGTLSIMYKGGNEIEYKVRNVEAFFYNGFVKKQYRGNGYISVMMNMLRDYLNAKGIDRVYLAVGQSNEPALRAYTKMGYIMERETAFVRIMKINVPYKVI